MNILVLNSMGPIALLPLALRFSVDCSQMVGPTCHEYSLSLLQKISNNHVRGESKFNQS